MKFTIVGHACMLVEAGGKSLLIDPWFVGSCYWRSWWNFPTPEKSLIDSLKPDYVYITHLHWDHYHAPSLRRLKSRPKYLLPKAPTTRMVDDLKASAGYDDHLEMPHGKTIRLGDDFEVTSYQFGPFCIDSAIVIKSGNTVLLNVNDTKFFGWPLKQITAKYPKIDFVFRSHSSASPIPYCIEGYETLFPGYRTQQDYQDEFSAFAIGLGARYAVPFASNHCFLHRDTIKYNETGVDPHLVKQSFERMKSETASATECVVMTPGSCWDSSAGFDLKAFDFSRRATHVAALAERVRPALQKQYEREEKAKADFKAFERYFGGFCRAVPRLLAMLSPIKAAFVVEGEKGLEFWCVDVGRRSIRREGALAEGYFLVETPALVLNDCCRKRMFSTWGASKRLKISMNGARLKGLTLFFALLDVYENDGLPVWKVFTPRQVGVYARRWRELMEYGRYVFAHKILRKPFSIKRAYLAARGEESSGRKAA